MKTIVFTPRAAWEFDALPVAAQAAIDDGPCRLAMEGRGDVKAIEGA